MSVAPDFWLSSGHHLLDRDADGKLTLTSEFLKAYLARPELVPPPDACAVEQALYRALLEDPRRSVSTGEIDAIADADARENWRHMIAFRDHLLAHSTIETGLFVTGAQRLTCAAPLPRSTRARYLAQHARSN